jgi:hypothetical protein
MSFLNSWRSELVIIMLVSSANRIGLDILGMILGRSLTYRRKNRGPNMEPWGTPCLTVFHSEVYFLES